MDNKYSAYKVLVSTDKDKLDRDVMILENLGYHKDGNLLTDTCKDGIIYTQCMECSHK